MESLQFLVINHILTELLKWGELGKLLDIKIFYGVAEMIK